MAANCSSLPPLRTARKRNRMEDGNGHKKAQKAQKTSNGLRLFCALLWLISFAATGHSQSTPNNYGNDESWLCRPGRHDACNVDRTTTIIKAAGKLSQEKGKADPNAPIDCFYVYPTVSTDATPNSDMTADPAELNVIKQQFARFASRCRPYAPLYRQVTLAGLRTPPAPGGGGLPGRRGSIH